jgi:TolB protein
MRLSRCLPAGAALAVLCCLPPPAAAEGPAPPAPPSPAPGAPGAPGASPDDLLGNIVVVAGAGRPLPKIAVLPSLSSDAEDVTVSSVVRRDLDLCGEFELLPESAAPQGLYLADSPVDVKAWSGKGVEAVVKVTGKPRDKDHAELRGQVYLLARGEAAVFDQRYSVPESRLRDESHRLADLLIGALTGQNGGFASHLAFALGSGGLRRVFTMDADGHDAKAVSPADKSAIAPAFGKAGELFYAAAPPNGLYQVYSSAGALVPIPYKGSVYGIAFSRDHAQVAVSLGVGSTLKVFTGADFASLRPASEVGMALHPSFSPGGKLAFSGEGRFGQRIFVDDKPVTPEGIFASSPVFCNHPDGVRLIFSAGAGKDTDLVATGEKGGQLLRLTQSQGRNSYPACSPDGRLLAFFSTRASGEGPGLYLMRVDGGRPKRISPLLGDTLRWDALPPGAAVPIKDAAAPPPTTAPAAPVTAPAARP